MFRLDIDPKSITWQRVVDVNDRHLRRIQNNMGDEEKGNERITALTFPSPARLMAILGLTTGLQDIRERLGRIVFGTNTKGEAITAEDLGAAAR